MRASETACGETGMGLLSVPMPRERQFFALFKSHAGLVVEGANTLVEMLAGYADGGRRDEYVAKIHSIEHAADDVTQLSSMDNGPAILKVCQEIDALESTADRVMRGAISKLFRNVVIAWILTIPASALMAAGAWWLGRRLF